MIKSRLELIVADALTKDVDEIPEVVGQISTKDLARFVDVVLRLLLEPTRPVLQKIKLSSIAREILSGPDPTLTATDAEKAIQQLAALLPSASNGELLESIIHLLALLAARISIRHSPARKQLINALALLKTSIDL